MSEVLFYHLTETRVEDALPGLLERCVERGWKTVVQTGGDELRDRLDELLWTWRDDSFLPHASDMAKDIDAAKQPVLLTTGPGNANGATVRFYVGGTEPEDATGYERIVIMFDGLDPQAVDQARGVWKRCTGEGTVLTYWQQEDGRWIKKR